MPLANSWPPWTDSALRLEVAPPAATLAVVEPIVVVWMPPFPPVAQRRSPLTVVAERTIFATPAPLRTVVVSAMPLASTSPTTRPTCDGSDAVSEMPPGPVVPTAAS